MVTNNPNSNRTGKIRHILKISALLICSILLFCFSSCSSQKRIDRIIAAFDSFENSENYIFSTSAGIYIGKRVIDSSDISYEGESGSVLYLESEGAYFYVFKHDSQKDLTLAYIDYNTLEVKFIDEISLPGALIAVTHYNNCFCFRTDDPNVDKFKQIYYVYDIATGEFSIVNTNDKGYENIEKRSDQNRSSKYFIEYYNNDPHHLHSRLKITDKVTGESKIIDNSLLKSCNEGKRILSLGSIHIGGFSLSCEKDGYIYILNYYNTDGFLGTTSHYFIMKYDFGSNTMEYYTSILFNSYTKAYLLYIP